MMSLAFNLHFQILQTVRSVQRGLQNMINLSLSWKSLQTLDVDVLQSTDDHEFFRNDEYSDTESSDIALAPRESSGTCELDSVTNSDIYSDLDICEYLQHSRYSYAKLESAMSVSNRFSFPISLFIQDPLITIRLEL